MIALKKEIEFWVYLPLIGGLLGGIFGLLSLTFSNLRKYVYRFSFAAGVFSMGFLVYLAWKGQIGELFFLFYLSIHIISSLLIIRIQFYFFYALLATAILILGFFSGIPELQLELTEWGVWGLITMVLGYYHLWHGKRREDKELHFNLFREMLDQSSRAMFLLDLDNYKVLSINQPGENLLLQTGNTKEIAGCDLLEMLGFNLTYLKKRFSESSQTWTEKSYFQIDAATENAGGKLELEIVLKKIVSHEQSFLLLRIQDVTGQRARDRDLVRSLSFNKSLVAAIPDLLVSLDSNNLIKSFHVPASYPGFAYQLFEQKAFESFLTFLQIDEVEQASIGAALKQLRKEDQLYQLNLDARIGEEPYNFELRMLGLGIQGEALCMFRDITDQVALQQTENRYKTLVENMNEGIIMTDPEENILFLNDQMAQILELNNHEIMGKKSFEVFDNESAKDLIISKSQNRQKGITEQYEISVWTSPNQRKQLLVAAAPYLDGQKHFLGTIAIITDISERKETEKKLEEKKYELDSFMYKASHDLKGPLASIIGITNIAQQEVSDNNALRYFDLVTQSAKKLDLILSELINLTRLNNAELELKTLDLNQLVGDVVESLRYLKEAEKMTFNVNLQHEQELYSDKNLLHSIVQNLIYNSILYRNPHIDHPSVTIISEDYPTGIKLCIRDNGIGIPKRIQNRVFEMFYRGNNQSRGSGLGLYIVKSAIEKLNGKVELTSHVDIGSEFTIFLPSLKK